MGSNKQERQNRPARVAAMRGALAVAVVSGGLFGLAGRGAESGAPAFQELFEVIRTNLAGVSEAELNRVMVDGLLAGLHPRVLLAAADGVSPAGAPTNG